MSRLFVTATGTGIGKTFVTAALAVQVAAQGRTVRLCKPVLSGFDPADEQGDAAVLLRAQGLEASSQAFDNISPWRFRAPLSPDMAAAREGCRIDFNRLVEHCREAVAGPQDVVLIEGIGGAFVPLGADHLVADWIAALKVPVLLVTGSSLGTLSHTIAAVEALLRRGVAVHAVLVSESADMAGEAAEVMSSLAAHLPGQRLEFCPRITGADPWRRAPDLVQLLPGVG